MISPEHKDVWVTFVGVLDIPIARALTANFSEAVANGVERVHLLIQSPGGNINEGVFLFNLIDSLPIEVLTYNCGYVGSAAVTAYLGAKKRLVSPSGTFMIHRSTANAGNGGTTSVLAALSKNLEIDDARTEQIIVSRVQLTATQMGVFQTADLCMTASEAVANGLATEIGHFKPAGFLRSV